ncbi:hypothetical protein ACHQM5_013905 [Ranunculus cassubicifolius]
MASKDIPIPPNKRWNLKDHIFIPTLFAAVAGGATGLVSKHRRTLGLANISATYATNCSIVTACFCGAREYVRVTREAERHDLISSAIGGLASGALLGRLQGGQVGAIKYALLFSAVGTAFDYTSQQLENYFQKKGEVEVGGVTNPEQKNGWLKMPEWSPIQILDEEALAAKRAREEKVYGKATIGKLEKEEC